MSASDCKELKQKLQKLKSVVDSLPIGNKGLLFKLLNLFSTIDKNQQETKMSAHNLAVVMGPTLIRSSGESFETMMTDSSKVVSVVTSLIVNLPYFQKIESNGPLNEIHFNGNNENSGKLIVKTPLLDTKDKKDWKKKYEEVNTMYDELRTQYSVLEAYSAKLDDKVAELEELLESMDQIHNTKPEIESNESEEMQKLRSENEGLKDIIIRFTREDVSNIREDSISIRQRDFPVKSSTIFPSKPPALVSPQTSDTDIPVVPEQDSDLKGKLSSTTLQLRKQISSKKIPKLRPSFRDSECHPQPAKREVSQSLKPRPPTDRRNMNMNIDLSLDKKSRFRFNS